MADRAGIDHFRLTLQIKLKRGSTKVKVFEPLPLRLRRLEENEKKGKPRHHATVVEHQPLHQHFSLAEVKSLEYFCL